MDAARADALAARLRLQQLGWIARDAESFRHVMPPPMATWLGDDEAAPTCAAHPLAGTGWTLHPVGDTPQGRVQARWLDAADPMQRRELLADLPMPEQDDSDAAPFAWAHRALCRHGLRLDIGGSRGQEREASRTVWIQLRHQPRAAVEAPLLIVDVQPGVACVLVEVHEREPQSCGHSVVQNLRVDVRLGDFASLKHVRVAMPGDSDRVAHHVHARLGRNACYEQAAIVSASAYHLQRSEIELGAELSVGRQGSVAYANGAKVNVQTRVLHGAAGTSSAVDGLALAAGEAVAAIDARTEVPPAVAHAAARQHIVGIPLGGQPRMILRPQLDVANDQVQAAHGAAWGALPEDALFYARQRGLDESRARAMMVQGMAAAVIQRGLGGEAPWMAPLGLDSLLERVIADRVARGVGGAHE